MYPDGRARTQAVVLLLMRDMDITSFLMTSSSYAAELPWLSELTMSTNIFINTIYSDYTTYFKIFKPLKIYRMHKHLLQCLIYSRGYPQYCYILVDISANFLFCRLLLTVKSSQVLLSLCV